MTEQDYGESNNDKKIADLLESKERYRILLEINNAIISNLKLDELFRAIAKAIREKLPFDITAIALYEPVRDVLQLYLLKTSASLDHLAYSFEILKEGTDMEWVLDNKKPLLACDLSREERFPTDRMLLNAGLRSYIITPLIVRDEAIGTLNIASKTPDKFQEADAEFLYLVAKQIAIAIDNARSHEEIEKLKNQLEKENIYLREEIKTEYNFEEIIGESKVLKKVLGQVEKVAKADSTVLIRGETGTGKELIARAIHNLGKRKDRPLIKVNCPAIPPGLIESELFGHEKGAFTSALSKKMGKFELADGGTIFLDEIGDLPLEAQAKLLRVLQEKEFERVGGNKIHKVDVRVIAATNRDLESMVKEGKFRSDLFYRLNVFPIILPPLRERKQDIHPLTMYFVRKYMNEMNKEIRSISKETMERLKEYSWPGNIRELQNVVERAVILSTGDTLEINETFVEAILDMLPIEERLLSLEDIERGHIIKVLNHTGWQIHGDKGAAKILGLNPSTLRTRMEKLGIKTKRQLPVN
ncbi:MAG TPA: sigma 54-interacting transcriptional regulator [Thermodesulfobacteriota bacterium]|nr:sigma 54-interacting transcriptional regulator [Thermodesulfobacteriota bacterium]